MIDIAYLMTDEIHAQGKYTTTVKR